MARKKPTAKKKSSKKKAPAQRKKKPTKPLPQAWAEFKHIMKFSLFGKELPENNRLLQLIAWKGRMDPITGVAESAKDSLGKTYKKFYQIDPMEIMQSPEFRYRLGTKTARTNYKEQTHLIIPGQLFRVDTLSPIQDEMDPLCIAQSGSILNTAKWKDIINFFNRYKYKNHKLHYYDHFGASGLTDTQKQAIKEWYNHSQPNRPTSIAELSEAFCMDPYHMGKRLAEIQPERMRPIPYFKKFLSTPFADQLFEKFAQFDTHHILPSLTSEFKMGVLDYIRRKYDEFFENRGGVCSVVYSEFLTRYETLNWTYNGHPYTLKISKEWLNLLCTYLPLNRESDTLEKIHKSWEYHCFSMFEDIEEDRLYRILWEVMFRLMMRLTMVKTEYKLDVSYDKLCLEMVSHFPRVKRELEKQPLRPLSKFEKEAWAVMEAKHGFSQKWPEVPMAPDYEDADVPYTSYEYEYEIHYFYKLCFAQGVLLLTSTVGTVYNLLL